MSEEVSNSGASLTIPIRAGEVKKGMLVFLKDHPCRVVDISTSKTGKHGHAKANMTGLDIFTGKKYMDISPTSHTMYAPVVNKTDWQLCDIDEENYCTLIDEEGTTKEDLQLPNEDYLPNPNMGKEIKDRFENDYDVNITVQTSPENLNSNELKEIIIDFNSKKE